MQEGLIRIHCPECHANFRVNPGDIPEQGASATCKKCGRRFTVRKSATGCVCCDSKPATPQDTERTFVTPAAIEPGRDALVTCPRCGHRQPQPFICYACGAVITPKETAQGIVSAPTSDAPAAAPDPMALFKQGMGEIVIRTRIMSLRWLKAFTRTRICMDGMDYTREWGVHKFDVPQGDCTVVVDYNFFLKSYGRSTTTVHVSNAEKVYLDYCVKTPPARASESIGRASLAEGTLWQTSIRPDRSIGKSNASRNGVIMSLLLLGPLGLIPLWKSDQFSNNAKIAITAGMILITLLIASRL